MADSYNASGKGIRSIELNNKDSDFLNAIAVDLTNVYINHMNYLINIITNLHTFEGLPINPDTGMSIRSSFFETMIIYNGMACIANTPDFGLIVTPCSIVGTLNIYGEPNELRLISKNNEWNKNYKQGLNITVQKNDFVLFRNDNTASSLIPLVIETAKMLTIALYGMDKNIGQQKFPSIIRSSQDTKLSVQHIIGQIDGYQPFVVIRNDSTFNPEDAKVFNTNVPYVADKMYSSYTDILNNFFMKIGVNILPNAKKERMIVDEVNSNNQAIRAVSDVYLNNRLEACAIARKKFPELKNLNVRRNNEFITTLENDENIIENVKKEVRVNE